MGKRHAKTAFYGFSVLLWIGVVYAFVAWSYPVPSDALLVPIFAAMVALCQMLRIRLGKIDVSSAALVGYLSITLFGPKTSALLRWAGLLGMAFDSGRKTNPWSRLGSWVLVSAPALMAVSLVAGRAYLAVGGVLGQSHSAAAAWLGPFLVLEIVYSGVNILLITAQQALWDWRNPLVVLSDMLRQHGPNLVVFLVAGVVLQSMYLELGVLSLVFLLALLLLARFVVGLYAEKLEVVSEMTTTLARMLSLRDPYTGGHSERVAAIAVGIGQALGLSEAQVDRVRNSALVHDIGKVAVPDSVLRKPGPLNPDEWVSMDVHVDAGGELLEQAPHLRHLAGLVRGHHADYADEVKEAKAPPLEARIIAVADAFDAMTSDRPYRRALPLEEAVRRLRAGAGSQFDPACVDGLVRTLTPTAQPPLPRCEAYRAEAARRVATRPAADSEILGGGATTS